MIPDWLKVIEAWRVQPGKRAPTLSFLYGALQIPIGSVPPDEHQAREEFLRLLKSIEQYQCDGQYTKIERCQNLSGEFVISIEDDSQSSNQNLVYRADEISQEKSREVVWASIRDHIMNGAYSFNKNRYGPFLEVEVQLIEKALGRS